MGINEATEEVIQTAKVMRRLADELLNRAQELHLQQRLTSIQLQSLENDCYGPMRRQANRLLIERMAIDAANIEAHVNALHVQRERLDKVMEHVARVEKIVAISAADGSSVQRSVPSISTGAEATNGLSRIA
ncbi:MAG: hypothetical protein ACFB9M_02685 [Myxococcota bacterium]